MKKVAAFIASGTGMGAGAAKHLSSKGYDIAIMSSSGKGERLANDLGCTEIEAYQSLVHHMIDPHCYENP